MTCPYKRAATSLELVIKQWQLSLLKISSLHIYSYINVFIFLIENMPEVLFLRRGECMCTYRHTDIPSPVV